MLRLFIAIDLPADLKALLSELQNQLRPRAPGVRWAEAQGTHLTLYFLGATPDQQREPVLRAMRAAAAKTRPFELSTAALGGFPKPAQPRVIWLGVDGDRDALAALQAAVTDALGPLGYAREERPFAPHLTLGRARPEAPANELAAIAGALRTMPPPSPIRFAVRHIVLMRSERLQAGARYTVLAEAPLQAAA